MKKIFAGFIACFLWYGYTMAQAHITGKITDKTGNPLPFASVTITSGADSTQFIGTATDDHGIFEFSAVRFSACYISAAMLGYATYTSPVLEPAKLTDTLYIRLEENITSINEFTLETRVNKIEIEAGKIVLNVEATSLSVGQTALDLLRKIPGVFVDNDGNIMVKGKKDVMVYVDGKPTYMSGSQLKNFLKSLNATNISKIEVISQPGANYDAEGNAGIINIVLKKKIALGFNGTLDGLYSQGFYPAGGGTFSFNYGKNKFNIYGSYSYLHDQGYIWLTANRSIENSLYNQDYWGKDYNNDHTLKFNFDYEFNKKWSMGAGVNVIIGHYDFKGHTRSEFRDSLGTGIDSIITVNDSTPWRSQNVQLNINTQWKIDTLGQKLSINADGGLYTEQTFGHYKYGYYTETGSVYRTSPDVNYSMYPNLYLVSGKIDYINPHVFKFHLETGIKSSYVTNEADITYRTFNAANQPVVIPGQTNHFIYEENINAIYLTLKRSLKKWVFNAGLRGEHTNITGRQLTTGEVNRQNYFSLFPSAGITFNPSDKHSLSFMYSRRIDRPEYSELNPFIYIIDNYSGSQGNPKLLPQFSHNFDLNYTMFEVLTFSASYNMIDNSITQVFRVDSLNPQRIIFSQANIGRSHIFSAGASFSMPVTKWWYILLNGNAIYKNFYDNTLNINQQGWLGMFTGYFEFTLPKKFTVELSAYLVTQQIAEQQIVQPVFDFSGGISKKLFKDKLTIKANFTDLFRTTQWRGLTTTQDGQTFQSNFWWDSRCFTLAFSWNFGKALKETTEKDKDAIFDRVGGGR